MASPPMRPLVDASARERIRTSLDESMLVEAAAGTGKTSELVARLIAVLAEGRGTVQSVVAVTFTEKAAGELKLRLRAELERARQAARADSRRRGNLDAAVAHLEEARVSTIHGFCNDLLHERPVEALVDPRFAVLTEPDAEAQYGRVFDRWIEGQLERPAEGLRRALRRRASLDDGDPVARLRRAGWTLAGWRDFRAPWRRAAFDREGAVDALVGEVRAFAALLRTCSTPADGLYADTWLARRIADDVALGERRLDAADGPAAGPRDYDGLEAGLVDMARSRQFRRPRKGYDRNYRGGATREEVWTAHGRLGEALDDFARRADADLAALLQQELFATVDLYEAYKGQTGSLDFLDLLLRTRDLVRDRADVREEWQRRFTHVFVDEFQDTDPLQAEILLLLSASDPAVARWREVTPAPGKLFAVGDPKQSIYRFRRADVGVYQEVKALLRERGAAVVELTTSFRAVPSLQRLVNAAFGARLVDDPVALQAGYVPLAAHRAERGGQPSAVALPVPRFHGRWGITRAAIEEALPDAVAAFVHWLVRDSGWRVTERDRPGDDVPVSPRHVCLLFRRFTHWGADVTQPYVEALEAREVPHVLVGGKSFHQREEVESVRTALTAIEWPDDELAVYGTLRGPLFAVGDEALFEYRTRVGRLHPFRLGPGGDIAPHLRPVADGLRLIGDLHRRRNQRPAEDTVADLLTATRAHAAFILRPSGERALANVLRIGELARAWEASGGISFRGFVEQLGREGEDDAAEAPVVEEGSEGVRIMTVHRAKGLEFPVVVLADIGANMTAQNAGRHIDSARGLCAVRLAGWSPWDLLDQEAAELDRDRAEGVRLAYVAATRARDVLVVPALGDDPFAGGWDGAAESWIEPVQRAVYPPPDRRRTSAASPGCPPFGEDSVLERSDGQAAGGDNVRPGLHVLGGAQDRARAAEPARDAGDRYPVVWWDPRALPLGVPPRFGIRRQDLIEDPGPDVREADRLAYDEWQRSREAAVEQGARPSFAVETVTAWARREGGTGEPQPDVELLDAASGVARPAGPRFGTLVHAVLATVALDAGPDAVAEVAELQARILGASADETAAATALATAALGHPLLARAREAWRAGRCRRESPISAVEPGGGILEGVLDLAFEEDEGWTVVDFKTQAELAGSLAGYRRQVGAYATMVSRATGRPARAVLLRL
jgi:ATP-dependent exoDNAse (exonuclease V) beta subunit